MPLFAYGPVAGVNLTVEQVVFVAIAGDAPAAPSGQSRVDVTTLLGTDDPNSIVGRDLNISTPTAPTVVVRDTTLADRRSVLKENLLIHEDVFQGVWEHRQFYSLWLEANCRAAAIDANLQNNTRHGWLLSESRLDGATWYWAANRASWLGYYWDASANDNAGAKNFAVWFQTTQPLTAANSVAGLPRSGANPMQMNQEASFDYTRWLRT